MRWEGILGRRRGGGGGGGDNAWFLSNYTTESTTNNTSYSRSRRCAAKSCGVGFGEKIIREKKEKMNNEERS